MKITYTLCYFGQLYDDQRVPDTVRIAAERNVEALDPSRVHVLYTTTGATLTYDPASVSNPAWRVTFAPEN